MKIPIHCKICKKIIVEDLEKLIKEERERGRRYIECPYCLNLEWINGG